MGDINDRIKHDSNVLLLITPQVHNKVYILHRGIICILHILGILHVILRPVDLYVRER